MWGQQQRAQGSQPPAHIFLASLLLLLALLPPAALLLLAVTVLVAAAHGGAVCPGDAPVSCGLRGGPCERGLIRGASAWSNTRRAQGCEALEAAPPLAHQRVNIW